MTKMANDLGILWYMTGNFVYTILMFSTTLKVEYKGYGAQSSLYLSICELHQILSKPGYHRTKRAYPLPLNNSFIAIQWLVGGRVQSSQISIIYHMIFALSSGPFLAGNGFWASPMSLVVDLPSRLTSCLPFCLSSFLALFDK